MTVKQWLSRGRGINREIDKLLQTKQDMYDLLTSTTANLTGDIVTATKDPHKYDRIAELSELIDSRIDELAGIKAEILSAINRLEDWRYREVLRSRYIDMKTWERTAVEMNYSYMQVTRLHGYALAAIREIIEEKTL